MNFKHKDYETIPGFYHNNDAGTCRQRTTVADKQRRRAQQADDARLQSFFDVNYLFTIYPSDTDTGNSLGFSTSHGFQFNNYLYFGGGIGFNSFFCDGTTRLVVPIFGELRCNFLNRRTTPFVCGRYGYGFGKIHGSYDSLALGMRLALKNNHSLTAGVEYSVQLDIGDNDYSQTNIGFRLGYEF